MHIVQWTGTALLILALGAYIVATIVLAIARRSLPFPSIFASFFVLLVGYFMATVKNSPFVLHVHQVNTYTAKANSIVFFEGVGLVRGISIDPENNNADTLFLNFKTTTPWVSLGFDGGINALAIANGLVYISQLTDTMLLTFDGTTVTEIFDFPGITNHLSVSYDDNTNTTIVFTTISNTVYANNVPIVGTTMPFAHCFHNGNLYISDASRLIIWRDWKIIRIIGPMPPARRMQIWLDAYIVIVPLRVGSQTQIFTLNGLFQTTIPGPALDVAVSKGQLFLSDQETIRVYEEGEG